jgi:hypothetical protein
MHDVAMTPMSGARLVNGTRLALELRPGTRGQADSALLRRKRDLAVLARLPVGVDARSRAGVSRLPPSLRAEADALLAVACRLSPARGHDVRTPRVIVGATGGREAAAAHRAAAAGNAMTTATATTTHFRRHVAALLRELAVPADVLARYRLPLCVEPGVLHYAGRDASGRPLWLEYQTRSAWRRMRAAAAADGITLLPVSGFRSAEYQARLLARKLARGEALGDILRVSALPGYSEHHLGATLDLHDGAGPPLEESFADTEAHGWLQAHAQRFGFRASYRRGNPYGIAWEPWHWRHHGIPLA